MADMLAKLKKKAAPAAKVPVKGIDDVATIEVLAAPEGAQEPNAAADGTTLSEADRITSESQAGPLPVEALPSEPPKPNEKLVALTERVSDLIGMPPMDLGGALVKKSYTGLLESIETARKTGEVSAEKAHELREELMSARQSAAFTVKVYHRVGITRPEVDAEMSDEKIALLIRTAQSFAREGDCGQMLTPRVMQMLEEVFAAVEAELQRRAEKRIAEEHDAKVEAEAAVDEDAVTTALPVSQPPPADEPDDVADEALADEVEDADEALPAPPAVPSDIAAAAEEAPAIEATPATEPAPEPAPEPVKPPVTSAEPAVQAAAFAPTVEHPSTPPKGTPTAVIAPATADLQATMVGNPTGSQPQSPAAPFDPLPGMMTALKVEVANIICFTWQEHTTPEVAKRFQKAFEDLSQLLKTPHGGEAKKHIAILVGGRQQALLNAHLGCKWHDIDGKPEVLKALPDELIAKRERLLSEFLASQPDGHPLDGVVAKLVVGLLDKYQKAREEKAAPTSNPQEPGTRKAVTPPPAETKPETKPETAPVLLVTEKHPTVAVLPILSEQERMAALKKRDEEAERAERERITQPPEPPKGTRPDTRVKVLSTKRPRSGALRWLAVGLGAVALLGVLGYGAYQFQTLRAENVALRDTVANKLPPSRATTGPQIGPVATAPTQRATPPTTAPEPPTVPTQEPIAPTQATAPAIPAGCVPASTRPDCHGFDPQHGAISTVAAGGSAGRFDCSLGVGYPEFSRATGTYDVCSCLYCQ